MNPSSPPAMRTERAYAKINLVLRILAREAGGYHGIETLFHRIALHDLVQVRVNDGPSRLECHGPMMPPDGLGASQDNLAWRAAEQYMRATQWDATWQIAIEKQVPVGGGLGGGSADAAAVLRALNTLAPTPLDPSRLLEIGGGLGADVPFLVAEDPLAWAWHRGDRFLPLAPLPRMGLTLVTFSTGINTGAAYAAVADARATGATRISAKRYDATAFSSWAAVCALGTNDFESVAMTLHAGVARVLPQLKAEAQRLQRDGYDALGMMSGSGATCFLLHPPDFRCVLDLPDGARVVHTTTG